MKMTGKDLEFISCIATCFMTNPFDEEERERKSTRNINNTEYHPKLANRPNYTARNFFDDE